MPSSTYVPSQYRSPYANSIGELLGQNNGALWGNTINTLGQIAGGAIQQRAEQKDSEKAHDDEMGFMDMVSSGKADHAVAVSMFGMEKGSKIWDTVLGVQEASKKKGEAAMVHLKEIVPGWNTLSPEGQARFWPILRDTARSAELPMEVPDKWNADLSKQFVDLETMFSKPKEEKEPLIINGQRVDRSSGSVLGDYRTQAAPPKAPDLSVEEGDMEAFAKSVGLPNAAALSWAQRQAFRAKRASSGRDPNSGSGRNDTRNDKVYQQERVVIDRLSAPIEERAARSERLLAAVDARTPAADALVGPEFLTVMAGGMGSGLRMNEAELNRIFNGRSNWESLKAKVMKWNPNSGDALSITDSQRAQIRQLIMEVNEKAQARVDLIDGSRNALIDAPDPMSARKITASLRSALSALGKTSSAPKPPEMVKYQGRTVPFRSLPPDIQAKVLALLPK